MDMGEIYQSYAQTVFRYLFSLTNDASLAEELTQETFYQAVKTSDRFDGSCKITTWLCGIAKKCLLTYRRKHPAQAELKEAAQIGVQSAESQYAQDTSMAEILKQMQFLPPDVREVMYLRLLGGLSFAEIGDVLSCTENRARVTFYRAKEKLKKELSEHE